MQCPRCHFENVPGRTRCFKCDSVLEASADILQAYPPRMPTWKKPIRNISRLIRSQKFISDLDLGLHWEKHPEMGQAAAVFLDLIPGLGHLFSRCLRKIWWLLLMWLALIATGVFFLPGAFGFLCIGLAIGVHIWILMRHNIIRNVGDFRARLIAAGLLLILLFALYHFFPRVVIPYLTGAYTSMSIPSDNIKPLDYFVATRNIEAGSLHRGSLVLIQPQGIGTRNTEATVGQIVALPGEHIEKQGDFFVINGQPLDNLKYPVPKWLRQFKVSFNIDEDSYFVTSEFRLIQRGRQLASDDIHRACVYSIKDLYGRVFIRWTPINKRGFIK